ncbi:heat-shock protein [Paracidovorax avenae]|uniref:Hsp70 family protein n=1 Tax=Paracidovorax avenae TaxID=80867 RepID=UPI000D161516|nr:Hsp70 family protein [Paracidovorax avenae]AVS80087.1 heat-shock protein [Paracidovorax avenae]AVT15221.1 heat-shock protein [Paracidovorax avenae]
MRPLTLGIDFGTSNSAMAVRREGGAAQMVPVEQSFHTLPTAMFFNTEESRTHVGRDAIAQYLAGTEGRLMRSLKSLLGSALLEEKTAVQGTLMSYQDIIALFLRTMAQRAQAVVGDVPAHVVLGRPVHFVDGDPARDALAEGALRRAAEMAGFADVSFQLEPIAAALDYEQRVDRETRVLVVDIGGGTSDFTVVLLGPERSRRADRSRDVLATAGVHLGGTDFDQRLSRSQVMPLLGLGHHGPSGREVPSRIFFDLSTWHLIQWLYSPKALAEAKGLRPDYRDIRLHDRLMVVLSERWGHRLAQAVEQAKIDVSSSGAPAALPLGWVERGLDATVTPASLADTLQQPLQEVVGCAAECLAAADLGARGVDALYLTGGSSALKPLRDALAVAFPGVPQVEGDLFGGVASGLAYTVRS